MKKKTWKWSEESKKNRKGKMNPNYRNGFYVKDENGQLKNQNQIIYKLHELKKTTQELIEEMEEKYGYSICYKCRTPNPSFQFHHVVYRSEMPKHENLHHPKNLICVCVKCHNWFHNKKDRRDYIIKRRKLWELFPEKLQPLTNTLL